MVSILVISHSHDFAKAAVELVSEMKFEDFNLSYLGGIENGQAFGSDPMEIVEKIKQINTGDGVMIIADMGSSIMNSQLAISMLDEALQKKVQIVNGPFFESLLASVVGNEPKLDLEQLVVLAEQTKNQDKF